MDGIPLISQLAVLFVLAVVALAVYLAVKK